MFHGLIVAAIAAAVAGHSIEGPSRYGTAKHGACGVESMDQRICRAAQQRFKNTLDVRVNGFYSLQRYAIDCNLNGTGVPFAIRSTSSHNPLSTSLLDTFQSALEGIRLLFNYDIWEQECTALSEWECKSAVAHSPCHWAANSFSPGGKCKVSDRTCVENADEETCLENSVCRWIPHDDPKEVSFVPCRFIGSHNELCDVYGKKEYCTNNPNCKWDSADNRCLFNGCHHLSKVDQTCACSDGRADPQDPVFMCRYGQKCLIKKKAVTRGPYLVISGECEKTTTLAPAPGTCHEFWIDSCKESAVDGTNVWRPLFDKWSSNKPASKPEETCCERTCGAWERMAKANSCGTDMLRRDKLCGSEGCSVETCCRPSCAKFECDANRPETLREGSVLKPNAQKIACKNEQGEEICTFTQCCEVTCLSKKGICDVLGKGGRKERLKENPQSFWCNKNAISNTQIEIAITSDKCDHNYCCDLVFDTCQEAKEAGYSVCGKNDYEDWVDKTEITQCGPSDNYKCNVPEHCCTRTCAHYLNHNDRHCATNFVNNNPDFACNGKCSLEACCVPTCKAFDCTMGTVPISQAATNICGATNSCNESTCCVPTCYTHQLRSAIDFCPVGKVFRDNLSILVCGAGDADCLSTDKEFCCQPTCLHYTTNTGCTSHYNVKQIQQDRLCSNSFPCNRDNCCEPTCNHFSQPEDRCKLKNDLDVDTGFSAIPGIGNTICMGVECTHTECCHRTCSQYLNAYGGCHGSKKVDTALSNFSCNMGCSEKQCCLETCESWHGCAQYSGLHPLFRSATCKDFPQGQCNQALCCQANCSPFKNCDPGFIKKQNAARITCTGSTGSLADCTSSLCCRPTCASYKCPADFQTNENTARICEDGQCTTDQCCDTTCASWIAPAVAGTCDALHILVANPNTFRCDYKNKDDDIYDDALTCKNRCCRETCGSFLATTNAGSHDGKCAIDGLSIAKNHDVACDESPTESCTSDFCCEYTCAKFVIASCVGNGLTYRKETKHLGCSENPRPVALINQTYTAEIQRNGKLILKHLYPCDRVFCCETVCRKVPECPVNELRVSNSECNNLTTCNLHKCCKCGAGASCHPDPDKDMKTKRCTIDYDGQSKKCEELGQCAPANDKLDEVPQACSCHTDKELAASEKDPSQTTLTDVCTEYFSEVCRVKMPQGKRCTQKCVEGGNKNVCVCGSTMCEANGYCQSGECQPCFGLSRTQCAKISAFCWWGALETETLPKSACIAIRLNSGQALLGTVGGAGVATGGISIAAIIGIAVGVVALLTAGIMTTNYRRRGAKSELPTRQSGRRAL
eukprot:GEMP01002820.1.p1 GENE.GEMP01002820.1~~GEMP01002820.1.p1  ORF type:complete len:1313 (+),score=141.92 GEMP01002820.1:120-4058(+)